MKLLLSKYPGGGNCCIWVEEDCISLSLVNVDIWVEGLVQISEVKIGYKRLP